MPQGPILVVNREHPSVNRPLSPTMSTLSLDLLMGAYLEAEVAPKLQGLRESTGDMEPLFSE